MEESMSFWFCYLGQYWIECIELNESLFQQQQTGSDYYII